MQSLFLIHFQFLWLFGFLYAMSGVSVSAHTMWVGMILVVRPYILHIWLTNIQTRARPNKFYHQTWSVCTKCKWAWYWLSGRTYTNIYSGKHTSACEAKQLYHITYLREARFACQLIHIWQHFSSTIINMWFSSVKMYYSLVSMQFSSIRICFPLSAYCNVKTVVCYAHQTNSTP